MDCLTEQVWYYAFETRGDYPVPYYERTFGCKTAAEQWAAQKPNRFVTTKDNKPEDFFY